MKTAPGDGGGFFVLITRLMMFAFIEFLPHGGFWCRPELVETTDDDVLANNRGELPEMQADVIALRLRLAANELLYRAHWGHC